MSSRLWDRIINALRGTSRPHWCSVHHHYFNANVFKDCPDCLKESGPFYHVDEQPARSHELATDQPPKTKSVDG